MANKTPYKLLGKIEITRTNNDVLEREIDITSIVQNAVLDYLSTEYGLTPAQVNNLVTEWRIVTMWIDVLES